MQRKFTTSSQAIGALFDYIVQKLFSTGDPWAALIGAVLSGFRIVFEPLAHLEQMTAQQIQQQLEESGILGQIIEETLPKAREAIQELAEEWANKTWEKQQQLEQELIDQQIALEDELRPEIEDTSYEIELDLMTTEDILHETVEETFGDLTILDDLTFELSTETEYDLNSLASETSWLEQSLLESLYASLSTIENEAPTSYEVEGTIQELGFAKLFEMMNTPDPHKMEEYMKAALDASQKAYMYIMRKTLENLSSPDIKKIIPEE